MAVAFHVLASGSSGNCSLLDFDDFGILIDLGIGPRQLAGRLSDGAAIWDRVRVALLTHVHGDHWNENLLNQLARRSVPLVCHSEHAAALRTMSPAFTALADAGLVQAYAIDTPFALGPGGRCEAFAVAHDSGVTCGFRLEGPRDPAGRCWALAYAADLGCWDHALADRLADVDVLALEFNHDVALQYQSGRSIRLIRRVLGDRGHLSNVQAAALLAEVLRRSQPGRLRHLVQLHLSQQCNRPDLAHHAARQVLQQAVAPIEVHTTQQRVAGPSLTLGDSPPPTIPVPRRRTRGRRVFQRPSLFPDWE